MPPVVIGLDIDKTVALHPAFFAEFSKAMAAAGHTIVVVTARRSEESSAQDLRAMGIAFHRVVCATAEVIERHGPAWRREVCRELGVDVLFDESPTVLRPVDARAAGPLVATPEGRGRAAGASGGARPVAVGATEIESFEADAADLMRTTPPRWDSAHKRAIAERSCPPAAIHRGRVRYSRWSLAAMPNADLLECPPVECSLVHGPMQYIANDESEMHWHLNFADPELFFAYGSPLLAQDEWQVLEHPVLGSLRERLVADGRAPRTREGSGATPVLIEGVERRCELRVVPGPGDRFPPLYGNGFARASIAHVLSALRPLERTSLSNIIAIAVPVGGRGEYTGAEVATILRTATTAFAAAVIRSRSAGLSPRTVIHTGLWGCGAFGGNPVLMTAVQLVAARVAGADELRFAVPDPSRLPDVRHGVRVFEGLLTPAQPVRLPNLVKALSDMGFRWGVGDGN